MTLAGKDGGFHAYQRWLSSPERRTSLATPKIGLRFESDLKKMRGAGIEGWELDGHVGVRLPQCNLRTWKIHVATYKEAKFSGSRFGFYKLQTELSIAYEDVIHTTTFARHSRSLKANDEANCAVARDNGPSVCKFFELAQFTRRPKELTWFSFMANITAALERQCDCMLGDIRAAPERSNIHYCPAGNPHRLREVDKQRLWCDVVHYCLIGPYFIDGATKSIKYLQFLTKVLPLLLEDIPLDIQQSICRWIGASGKTKWPSEFPDLSLMDFLCVGNIKSTGLQIPNTSLFCDMSSRNSTYKETRSTLSLVLVRKMSVNGSKLHRGELPTEKKARYFRVLRVKATRHFVREPRSPIATSPFKALDTVTEYVYGWCVRSTPCIASVLQYSNVQRAASMIVKGLVSFRGDRRRQGPESCRENSLTAGAGPGDGILVRFGECQQRVTAKLSIELGLRPFHTIEPIQPTEFN
ncbi:hypothetical protein PR048_016720 [Dryococelus australis]|uniref:Uncharacterized protein n=1 Tax=Dryococelus australis TaxID=614101 RepID=A0ABQ9H7H6_9NEOP|nr:hypothetical protein PR048_016720 [Dryococelus australis]